MVATRHAAVDRSRLKDSSNVAKHHEGGKESLDEKRERLSNSKRELSKRVSQLKVDYEKAEIQQVQAYHQNKSKLSSSIQSMTLREFHSLHKVDLLQQLIGTASSECLVAETKSKPMVLETPSAKHRGKSPKTPSTVVRRRETLFESASDVDALVATVSKDSSKRHAFGLSVGEGTYISLSDPNNITEMDEETKNVAFSQLQLLQDQVASIMNKLKEQES